MKMTLTLAIMFISGLLNAQVMVVCTPEQIQATKYRQQASAIAVNNTASQQLQTHYNQLATYYQQIDKDNQQKAKDQQQISKDAQQIAADKVLIERDGKCKDRETQCTNKEKDLGTREGQCVVKEKELNDKGSLYAAKDKEQDDIDNEQYDKECRQAALDLVLAERDRKLGEREAKVLYCELDKQDYDNRSDLDKIEEPRMPECPSNMRDQEAVRTYNIRYQQWVADQCDYMSKIKEKIKKERGH